MEKGAFQRVLMINTNNGACKHAVMPSCPRPPPTPTSHVHHSRPPPTPTSYAHAQAHARAHAHLLCTGAASNSSRLGGSRDTLIGEVHALHAQIASLEVATRTEPKEPSRDVNEPCMCPQQAVHEPSDDRTSHKICHVDDESHASE